MDDKKLALKLKKYDEKALEAIMDKYTPLVSTIIYNISSGMLCTADIEETVADVFITLWKNADKVDCDKLKGYICCIAKSKAKNKIRDLSKAETVDISDVIIIDDFRLDKHIESKDTSKLLIEAVNNLGEPDNEIVLRHYYYYQSSTQIAESMGLNNNTVKSRLRRAKEKLKELLLKRGVKYELT